LLLGLDLQGGMSVTMEVGLDGLLKSLANYTKDPAFNNALASAVKLKANSNNDLVSLFSEEFKKQILLVNWLLSLLLEAMEQLSLTIAILKYCNT
jgi:preprotein translocase subunit SecD